MIVLFVQVKWKAVRKMDVFRPIYHFISRTIRVMAEVTTEDEWELVRNLSNGAISNDFERQ